MKATFRAIIPLLVFSIGLLGVSLPAFSQAHDYMKEGEGYYIKGNYEDALRIWHKAEEAAPDNLVIKKYVALARDKLAGIARAEEKDKDASRLEKKELARSPSVLTKITENLHLQPIRRGPSVEEIILKEKKVVMLKDCIDIAIDNDTQLRIAKRQVKLGELRIVEAKRKLGPSLTFKWEESSGEINDRHYAGRKVYFEGKQPVYYGGELYYSMRQAEANLEVIKLDYQRIKDELVLEVKKAYYNLDKNIKAVAVQARLADEAARLLEITKKGYEAGIINKVEFLYVLSQYNQADFQRVSAVEDIEVSKLVLQQALNTEAKFDITPVGEPTVIEANLDDCYTLAFANHPKIKINLLMQDYYDYEKRIARAKGYLRLDFMGSYGKAYEQFVNADLGISDFKRGMAPQWYVGFKTSMPMFGNTMGYSLTKEKWPPVVSTTRGTQSMTHVTSLALLDKLDYYSEKEEADIAFERALQEIERVREEVTLDVKETFFKYKKAVIQLGVAKSKIAHQEANVALLEERRKYEESGGSDVLEAMLKRAEEEFSYLQAIADYYIAVAGLNKAIGIEEYFQAE